MHLKRLAHFKPFIVLGVAFAAWVFLPMVAKTLIRTSFYEFQAPIAVGSSYVRDLQDYWAARLKSNAELYEAGGNLARANAGYEIAALENLTLKREITRLEQLLGLPSRPDYRYEIARVAERDFNSWWQRITIRKGRDYNIPVGAPVVFVGGVVGRVREVHAYTSVIELISSSHLRLAVVIEDDNRPLSYRGAGFRNFGQPIGVAEYVPMDVQIEDPRNPPRLITSGMGGVFPDGLHVGYIRRLRQGAGGMFNDGEVQLDERLSSITEVAVLIKIPAEP